MKKTSDICLNSYAEYVKNFYEQEEIKVYFDDYYSNLKHVCGLTILDNGCGIGLSSKRLLRQNNRVISLEYNPYILRCACEKRTVKEPILGDCQYLPIKSNSIDIVIFHDVLEHLSAPSQALGEIYRVLRTKGRLYLITPNGLWSRLYLRFFPDTIPNDPTHIFEFNWKELKWELRKIGMKIISARACSLPLVNKISTRLSRRLAKIFGRAAVYIACPAFWITAEKA